MKQSKIVLVFFLAIPLAHADLESALDPWGARHSASELRAKTDDLRTQVAARAAQKAELEGQIHTLSDRLNHQREVISNLKAPIVSTLKANSIQLNEILEQQRVRIKASQDALAIAREVQRSVNAAATSLAYLAGSAQAMRILEPLFVNSVQNRELWLQALVQLERKPNIKNSERKAIATLRTEVDKANDWFWRRPGTLMEDFNRTMLSFDQETSQALTEKLVATASSVVDGLSNQVELQTQLYNAVDRTKSDHDQLMGAIL